ncbi:MULTISPECIES: Tse2 family ADP-ribosyltransferase toxin [Planktothricoides]|uniref:Tse2 ADP-ribosyltransferase toxin domain-containing protein n=1 Tax=Planktothricoides raciborskii GIHE-MW2 TaxID=2792601 RepID=A0AAU8JD06_9CYAN|nr:MULTISPECIES: hypothetical protein [Planktothricoides]
MAIDNNINGQPIEPKESVNGLKQVVLSTTLYTFGNKQSPRTPRQGKDIAVENNQVQPTQPPTGASTFADIDSAPLTGHYHRLEKNTLLPEGLDVIADGRDVGGPHSPTHHTIYPNRKMLFTEFVDKFLNSGWVYVGKKELK